MKKEFLVCYNYGSGGIWLYILARNKKEIQKKYPELKIVDERPEWFNDERELITREKLYFDIDEPAKGWLAVYEKGLKEKK
ncbi:MAG: hypothetical protein IIA70_03210 [Proteobacteria bacterium]|nr:hypothetical protein [Pseudomonadota bacterium]